MRRLGHIPAAVGLSLLVASLLAPGCDGSGGNLWGFQPDMTWGPGSNSLYSTDEAWGEQFCTHVHITCQDDPESYEGCLAEWGYSQEICPSESTALLSCIDALYSCGDWGNWEWWDMVTAACAPELYQYELCTDPQIYYD
jgi:hypothetical protein